jgi:hypothetical protein
LELSRPLVSLEADKTEIKEKVSRKTEENPSIATTEEKYTNKFDEVDGQFSMFANESIAKPPEPIKPDPTYKSISNFLYKKTFAYSDKILFEKILNSIDAAIKKRA